MSNRTAVATDDGNEFNYEAAFAKYVRDHRNVIAALTEALSKPLSRARVAMTPRFPQ